MSLRNASNWGVSDDDIRHMSPELRQRIRDYEEQRREGQTLMHQLAHPPGDGDFLETEPDGGFPNLGADFYIVALLALIAIELAVVLARL